MSEISDQQLLQVITDFLEMGHVENIRAMFMKDVTLYRFTGDLLRDERFAVRLGTAVLFEELQAIRPDEVPLAIPALLPLLTDTSPILRGEAATILGIINTRLSLGHIQLLEKDPDPQVVEIVRDILSTA